MTKDVSKKEGNHFGKVELQVEVLKKRNLTPRDCFGCYIENTNLHMIPCKGVGVLVAYSTDMHKKREKG